MLLKENQGKILLIWDNLSVHKSKEVKEFLTKNTKRLQVEFLPPYASELNPQEYIWGRWKRNDMANYCPQDLSSLSKRASSTLRKYKSKADCLKSCWRQAAIE